MNNKIHLKIIGKNYRKTLVATREPLELILLNSVNALIEPHLLPILAKWLKSINLKQAAEELGTSVSWCHKFKKELLERQARKNAENIPPTNRERPKTRAATYND